MYNNAQIRWILIKGVFIIDLDGDANVDANFYKN